MGSTLIRPAEARDLGALTRIYNHYVCETPITFDVEPYTEETRRPWLEQFTRDGRYRLLVAERAGEVLGYAGTTRFRPKAAYDTSVETTVYLDPAATGRGLGARLYTALFAELEGLDIHRVLAGITLPNEPSLALHRRFGFQEVGTFRAVGRKFGSFWDVIWLEKPLG
jgi:phosphinothricin acetyltransferase